MAYDCYIEITDAPGESTDDKHKDWIEADKIEYDVSNTISINSKTGGIGAGNAKFGRVRVTKAVDKASVKLALACASGGHFDKATIHFCDATGEKTKYFEAVLDTVAVERIEHVADAENDSIRPTEIVDLAYGKFTWTYTELDQKTNKPKGDVSSNWSVIDNTGG